MTTGKYFSDRELSCSHCGRNEMRQDFVDLLDEIREACDFPLPVSSGYRCPEWNERIGGAKNHPDGVAVDITVSGERAYELVWRAMSFDIRGVGVKQRGHHSGRFVHLDMQTRPDVPRPWIWSY